MHADAPASDKIKVRVVSWLVTTAVSFSFKYDTVPEIGQTDEVIKAVVVESAV